MTFFVDMETEAAFSFDLEKVYQDVARAALTRERFPFEAEISLTVTDGEGIRELNRDARGIDRTTDVLSFPMLDFDAPADYSALYAGLPDEEGHARTELTNPDTGEVVLGDIVICADLVKKQAREYGHSEKREFAFLIAHSMLHLLGFDHLSNKEAEAMEGEQRLILDSLGITRDNG